jgi:FkbM family methyltransferase
MILKLDTWRLGADYAIVKAPMGYRLVKAAADRLHLYRQLRWAHRHLLAREDLHRFRAECALYGQFVKPRDLCFDVGANYGVKTEVFLALGARTVAFEPQPDCFQELRRRNPRAEAVCVAIGSTPGTAVMYVDEHRTGSSLLPAWRSEEQPKIEVPVTTLDLAIERHGLPAFCKIDVEGLELDVLRGLTRRIRALSFEFTRHRLDEALKCLDNLARFGSFEANFTPRDEPTLISDLWMPSEEARLFLERTVPTLNGCEWGDVFVRFPDS